MAKRREFTRDTASEIMKRAKVETGFRCEWCNSVVTKGEIHHVKQDAMETDKRRKLTAQDGVFLCKPCHDAESKRQAPVMAKVKRCEAAELRIKTPTANPIRSAGFAKFEKPPRAGRARIDKTALIQIRWNPLTGERI